MRITIDGNRARPVLLGLLAVGALVAVTVLATAALRLGGGAEQAAAQEETSIIVSLDMDTSDGPCTDIDGAISHATGDSYSVAICVEGLYATSGVAIGTLSFDVLYDDTLNIAPEVANTEQGLDDNPDANAGTTIWGDGLGTGFDCSAGGVVYPTGDTNPASGPGNGDALISCSSIPGPWTLGDNETSGVIAVISFAAIAGGTDTLTIANGLLGDEGGGELGTCNPAVKFSMTCNGGTDTNGGAPVPVPTSGPGPIAPPPDVVPPPVAPGAPPVGVPVPVIVAPPTGSGPAGDGSPWTALGWLLVGAVGTAIAAGGLLRLARARQR